jgi:mono/diheme cytochrome c family protein
MIGCRTVCLLALWLLAILPAGAQDAGAPPLLPGRVIAVGVPGAAAMAQVGYFHPGGRIYDDPAWATLIQPHHVLDPRRLLVTSTSNFGAATARPDMPAGTILSIDPYGPDPVVVPPNLGTLSEQAIGLDDPVLVFSAQSPAFLRRADGSATARDLPPVSNPLGLAINNGSGRMWIANAPLRGSGPGLQVIVEPSGSPMAAAPNSAGGAIFSGDRTNRRPQLIDGGLNTGAVATAVLGPAPDGSKRAVAAVLTADGALIQVHGERGVDGLAPADTVTRLPLPAPGDVAKALITRAGMVFNWVPDRILYVSDPVRNAVIALKLTDDGSVFRVESIRRINAPEMNAPVDLAPAVPETANPGLSSSATLAGGADFYVVNRGSGVILRMNQAGQTVAARRVAVAGHVLGAGQVNGIAVSRDAQRIWLTVTGGLPNDPNTPGAVIEVPAFGPTRIPPLTQAQQTELVERGAELFQTAFTPDQGLGPLYNGTSCHECHQFPSLGGNGPEGLAVVYRVGRFNNGAYDPMLGGGGPVSRKFSISPSCKLTPGVPQLANLVSVRNTPSLFGDGVIDTIPDMAIRARAAAEAADGNGVAGRPHFVRDPAGQERIGRFGWKADTATLEQFIAEAMRNEMGLTTPLAPQDIVAVPPGCGLVASPKFDSTVTRALAAFVASLPIPSPGVANAEGAALFASIGCGLCHAPSLPGPVGDVPLYSDLLLHDMGPALDDGVVQGQARGRDWRTTPLWGLGVRVRYLHDGRATSLTAAIAAHDGEAARAAGEFRKLTVEAKERLLAFLGSL